jgi:DNA-binding response OmpR family regulator
MTAVQTRPKIVIVDDSEIVRGLVEETLEDHGYDVVGIESPFELSGILARVRPDLVLLDVMLPALPGDKVVTMLRRVGGDSCPIVLFSDRDEAELAGRARACGAAGYISKREEGGALAARVAHFLAKSK